MPRSLEILAALVVQLSSLNLHLSLRLTTVSVTTSAIAMSMTEVMKERESNEIDQQSEHRHNDKILTLNLGRREQSLNRLNEYKVTNEQQEHTIHETGQDFVTLIAVCVH